MRVRGTTTAVTVAALVATAVGTATPVQAATASELVAAIFDDTSHVVSSVLTQPAGADGASTAVRSDAVAGFPTAAGGGTYAVLSSGSAEQLTISGPSAQASTSFSPIPSAAPRAGTYDVTTLEVTLDVPAGSNCLLGVDFRFLSEEYPQYLGAIYNDAFIAEVGESTWSIVGGEIVAPNNFAFDSSGRVVSINAGLFSEGDPVAEAAGTVFNAASPILTAAVPLTGGTTQKLFFTIFDQADAELDSAVMIDNLRIGTVGDPATQCTPGATAAPDLIPVTAPAPTQVDAYGTADDTYTIPAVTGVRYAVDGADVGPGTYPGTGTVVVTATPLDGFELSGPSQFTLVFTDVHPATAVEPTWTDEYGTASDTYTIPAVTGVQYAVDGTPVAPGTYPATGTVVVTASATTGYVLTGPSEFTHTFSDIRQASAVEPTWTDAYGTADDTYTIPTVEGVQYAVDGTPVAPGTHPATGTVVVTASATTGYVLTGPSEFTHTFTDIRLASATEPTWTDEYGTASDTYTIPAVTGVQYAVDGAPVAPGTHPATGTVVVTASAAPGYVLEGPAEFVHTFTDIRLASAVEPTWTDAYGTADDTYTIPAVTGVQYAVDGTPVAPGTHPATGTVVVTASATTGYVLTGPTEFTRTFTDIRLVTAVEPTWTDTYGTADDTYTIPTVEGVQYAVDGTPVTPGTHPATGTVVVTAAATTGYVLTGPSQFTRTFTDVTAVQALPPTVQDHPGTAADRVVVPSVTGVVYLLDGSPVPAGPLPLTGDHVLTVQAVDARYELVGPTQFPVSLSAADVPGQVVDLAATPGPGRAVLTWTAPAGDVTGYVVQTTADGSTWTTVATPTGTTATVTGLTDGEPRVFRVAATNTLGTGAWSSTVSATPVRPADAPRVTQVVPGNRHVTVHVAAPASDGGAPVEGYEYSVDGGSTWVPVTGSPFTVPHLTNGVAYDVVVRAVTAAGPGEPSSAAAAAPVVSPVAVDDGSGPALPTVRPGAAAAWVDGAPVPVTLSVRDDVAVRGDGFRVSLRAFGTDGAPLRPDAQGRLVVEDGGYVAVSGTGFAPGTDVDVWLFSLPVLLGTATVGADGGFAARFALPDSVPVGEHTVQLNGTAADGTLLTVAAGLVVQATPTAAPTAAPSAAPAAAPAAAGDRLAATGSPAGLLGLVALCLLGAGGTALVVRRRGTVRRPGTV